MVTVSGKVFPEGDITLRTRMLRAVVALIMVAYPALGDGATMGVFALLPLIAIYPMYTAVVGWDPVKYFMDVAEPLGRAVQLQWAARLVLAIIGSVMIGATLTVHGELGWFGLLALLAIGPVFIAIIGENPLHALRESNAAYNEQGDARRVRGSHAAGPALSMGESAQRPSADHGRNAFSRRDKAA